jgi:hypothetical protein
MQVINFTRQEMRTITFIAIVFSLAQLAGAGEVVIRAARHPDFGFLPRPDEGYVGRVFELSQNYPTIAPDESQLPKFLEIDFQHQWREYLIAARQYCFNGNITGGWVEDDFDASKLNATKWFHMPWQHYGDKGREGIHGLTKEAKIKPKQLAATQMSKGQTYAIAYYNEFGSFKIGEIWKNPVKPANLKNIRFPKGTVVFKLLFADIPMAEVPSLVPPLEWRAYVTETYESTKRTQKMLSLIQMDIMIRDDRAPLKWVFGSYQYNGAMGEASRWNNLVPIGIQWGNDPDVKDDFVNTELTKTIRNPNLRETIINPDDCELPPTHLGWSGRLNGPVDNPESSCMSCHAVAQVIEVSPLGPMFLPTEPERGSEEWMRWFKNYEVGAEFDEGNPSADYSLQLAISLQNYRRWKWEARGAQASSYKRDVKQAAEKPVVDQEFGSSAAISGNPNLEAPITRDLD